MSPLALRILLDCYTCPAPLKNVDNLPSKKAITFFFENSIIKYNTEKKEVYDLTEKGMAWVKIILSAPMPEKVYINPVTKEVV